MSPKDLDKLFREALSEGLATPRPEAWARVAASLPKAEPEAQPKRRTLWWPYAAAASVAIAAVGTWWMQAPGPEASSTQLLVSSNQSLVTSNQPPAPSNKQPAASNQSLVTSSQSQVARYEKPETKDQ